jgi:alkanesulfonate monooxygenase SsuD/methylene tetrahydromethanopterin reductase-like flavin-dependent oxidoreductase (luciferase family)
MRLAVRYADVWVTNGRRDYEAPVVARDGAMVVADQISQLEEACVDAGRDPSTLRRLVLTGFHLDAGSTSVDDFCETIGRYSDVGVTDLVVHWPRSEGVFAGDRAGFEAVVGSRAVRALID